jgi:hypothetical protein
MCVCTESVCSVPRLQTHRVSPAGNARYSAHGPSPLLASAAAAAAAAAEGDGVGLERLAKPRRDLDLAVGLLREGGRELRRECERKEDEKGKQGRGGRKEWEWEKRSGHMRKRPWAPWGPKERGREWGWVTLDQFAGAAEA